MTTKITADSIVKAILAAKAKDTLPEAIARATGGEQVSPGIISKVEATLTERFVDPETDDTRRAQRAAMVKGMVLFLKASGGLPEIIKSATALFPKNGPRREGNKLKAIRAGAVAFCEGRNDVPAAIEAAVPVLSTDDARAKRVRALRALLERATSEAGDLGLDAEITKKLTAITALIQ